eukprot:scaffold1318_cov388-Prasinococcus_capsulatus_cf.AAC.95
MMLRLLLPRLRRVHEAREGRLGTRARKVFTYVPCLGAAAKAGRRGEVAPCEDSCGLPRRCPAPSLPLQIPAHHLSVSTQMRGLDSHP